MEEIDLKNRFHVGTIFMQVTALLHIYVHLLMSLVMCNVLISTSRWHNLSRHDALINQLEKYNSH